MDRIETEKKRRSNTLTIKLNDEEIRRKCSMLYRLNGVIIETLLKLLFSKVDATDILKIYIKEGVEGIRELIEKTFQTTPPQLAADTEDADWELRI